MAALTSNRRRVPGQSLVTLTLVGVLVLLVLAATASGSTLVLIVVLGLAVGLLALALFGATQVGTVVMLAAYGAAPMYKGLAPSPGSVVTAPDALMVLGFALLGLRMLSGRPRFHPSYTIGFLIIVVAGCFTTAIAPGSKDTAEHLILWWAAIFLLPLALMLWNPSRTTIMLLAAAYIAGQLFDTAWAVIHDGSYRWTGLATQPNYFGQAALLSCALVLYLLGEAPKKYLWLVWGSGAVCAADVIMSGSRAATVVLAVLLVAVPFIERTAKVTLFMSMLGALAAIGLVLFMPAKAETSALGRLLGGGTSSGSDLARSEGLHGGISQLLAHPIVGNGMTTAIIFPIHDGLLEVAVCIGIFGLFGYLLVQWSYIRLLFTNLPLRRLGYVGLAYLGFGATVPGLADRSIWVVVSLGALAIYHRDEPDEATDSTPSTTSMSTPHLTGSTPTGTPIATPGGTR